MTSRRWLLVALAVLLLSLLVSLELRAPQRVLYLGGPILSMDASNRLVEALVTEGARIVALGEAGALRTRYGRDARVVDLQGHALLPGFIDAHGHFPGSGIYAVVADVNSPPIGQIERIADLVDTLRGHARNTRRGDWVVGMGYDDTLLAERRHPLRADLDRASSEHPVAVWHVSGHLVAVNSLGLERLEIDANTPNPDGGRIRRDAQTGEPDGVLEETATDVLEAQLPDPGLLDSIRILRRASRLYLEAGVTTAQNGYATVGHLTAFRWLARLGLLPLRVVLWPGEEAANDLLEGRVEFRSPDRTWLRLGAVKLIADGSIQGYTGFLSRPYHVPPGLDPGYRGYPVLSREKLFRLVNRYHTAGWQVAVHGNGDAAIDLILDAFEAAQRAQPRADARHVVVHAQMARDDQLDRMAELGVIPSFFSLHTYYWGDRHREIFMGPDRAARLSPARSALERGVRFTIHADAPVVPMEPLRLVWSAVNRRSTSGATIGAAQRISVIQALRAVTIDAAYQHFEEDEKGSLEPGKLADLVLLDRSPLDDPVTIDRIRVLETIVAGRSVYRAGD